MTQQRSDPAGAEPFGGPVQDILEDAAGKIFVAPELFLRLAKFAFGRAGKGSVGAVSELETWLNEGKAIVKRIIQEVAP